MTSEENKSIVLDIILYIDKVCRENSIEYSLGAGTLLGAVRHGGFIPWDDDGDIIVKRSDYDRLMEILSKIDNDRFGFISDSTKGYYYAFAKVYDKRTILETLTPQDAKINDLGVYVDIFPIDKVPTSNTECDKFYTDAMSINYSLFMSIPGFYYYNTSLFKRVIKKILYYPRYLSAIRGQRNPEVWKQMLLNKIKSYKDIDVQKAGFTLSEYGTKEYMNSKIFEDYKDIEFEKRTLRGLNDYNGYLISLYGDYMELPPIDKREPKHAYIEYWKDSQEEKIVE